MSSRDTILATLRANRPDPAAHELPPVAVLGDMDAGKARFEDALQLLGGQILLPQEGDTLATAIVDQFQSSYNSPAANMIGGVLVTCCPASMQFL